MKAAYPTTPDGRYFVVKGRLWRCTNPSLSPATKAILINELMQARETRERLCARVTLLVGNKRVRGPHATFAVVPALFLIPALVASVVPAQRAANSDPMIILRRE